MSTTQHTGHYNLPTFGDNPNDRPSWRGDFTDAMTKIDNQMYANATNITTATNTANDAKSTAQAAQSAAGTAQSAAESAQGTANSAKRIADNALNKATTNETNIARIDKTVKSSVLNYGADASGAADSTEAFRSAIAANPKGFTVPEGVYKISGTLDISVESDGVYGIDFKPGAKIVAQNVSILFNIHANSGINTDIQNGAITIRGGEFYSENSNNCFTVGDFLRNIIFSGCFFSRFKGDTVKINHKNSTSVGLFVTNCKVVTGYDTSKFYAGSVGFNVCGLDSKFYNCEFSDVNTAIKANSCNIANVHVFANEDWKSIAQTVGIETRNSVLNNVYIDSLNTGVKCYDNCMLSNIYVFNYWAVEQTAIRHYSADHTMGLMLNGLYRDGYLDNARALEFFNYNAGDALIRMPSILFRCANAWDFRLKAGDPIASSGVLADSGRVLVSRHHGNENIAKNEMILIGYAPDTSSCIADISIMAENGYNMMCENAVFGPKESSGTIAFRTLQPDDKVKSNGLQIAIGNMISDPEMGNVYPIYVAHDWDGTSGGNQWIEAFIVTTRSNQQGIYFVANAVKKVVNVGDIKAKTA